jgi:peptidyl-prolyl cis-trans isomerase D
MFRHNMIIDKYIKDTVVGQVKVTQQDEAQFYQQNSGQDEAPRAGARQPHPAARRQGRARRSEGARRRPRPEEALAKARRVDFAALAREYSQDPGSAQRGGDLGYFEKGSMVAALRQAAFSMKVGAISDIVETGLRLSHHQGDDHRPEGVTPIDDVRQRIHEYLAARRSRTRCRS